MATSAIQTGPRGYSPIYGGLPTLPSTGQLSSNITSILNNAIPGFSNLTRAASSNVGNELAGQLPTDVTDQIRNTAATQAVINGMPGSSNIAGTVFGNRTLKDIGLTSLGQQQTGFKDLLSLLQGFSGTVAPTYGQAQEQGNQAATIAAAPIPAQAQNEAQRLYEKYANPGGGFGSDTYPKIDNSGGLFGNLFFRSGPSRNQSG